MSAQAQVHSLPGADQAAIEAFLASTVRADIHVVVIPPDDGPLPYGQWFGDDAAGAAAWATSENRKRYGVYWTVNVVQSGYQRKPKKEHIVAARFCHVDLDPPKDGSPWDRAGVLETLEAMAVPPTFINDSGGGLQAFWRLDEPGENLAAVEALNKRLALLLGGDHCHNIDRLMRLPGSVNWPNKLKRERGRGAAMASVVATDHGEVAEAEELHAILPPLPPSEQAQREHVRIDGVEPVGLDQLKLTTVDPLLALLVKDDQRDRSERVLKAAGLMVRRGLDNAVVSGVLLNPALAISAHCLDQPNPMRAAERAIGKARADVGANPGRHPANAPTGASGGSRSAPPPIKAVAPAEVSEDVIALAFTEENKDRLRYDHDVGRWFSWDGARWQREETMLAFDYARRVARMLGDGQRSMCRASVASGAERFAQADRAHAVRNDVWDSDPFLLGTPAGTVDLRTGDLFDPRPADLITKLTGASPEHGEPTLWLKFLADSTGNDHEMIGFLQQWTGYCLTGDTREHALAFVYGPGGNGKSVFLNTVTGIMGDYAVTSAMEAFTASAYDRHSTELAMLRGARLVTANETEEGRAWAEARIKALTGSDPITARFMRQDFFTFRPEFKLMIAGNHAPALKNVDDAMRRRFNIIPFTLKPAAPDKKLEEKLRAEWGQILTWAIRGCRDWLANGLVRPAAVLAATNEYFEDQDVFGQWFNERCMEEAGRFETVANFYSDWGHFAKDRGEEPGSNKSFGTSMKRRGYRSQSMRNSGIVAKVYRGIALQYARDGGE